MEISVVFPLVDGRVDEVQAVRSWTHLQTLARSRFQVIAVSDGADPALEKLIAPLLAPHDLLVRHPTDNFIELYDIGIRRAQGRFVVLTEHHCVADPHCLAAVERFFEESQDDGGCLNIDWVCMNEVARLKWNERNKERLSYFNAADHWNKFLFAGFAVRREALLAIGGIDFQYGLFCELAVGAQLHHAGFRLGHLSSAVVQHLDNNSFAKVLDFIRNFTEGEVLFLANNDADVCHRYIGTVPEWEDRRNDRSKAGRQNSHLLARVLWSRCLAGNWSGIRGLVGELRSQLTQAVVPVTLRLWLERLGVTLACGRFIFWRFSESRRIRALNDACNRMVHYVRMKCVQRLGREDQYTPPAIERLSLPIRWDMGTMTHDRAAGVFAVETVNGRTYRWSEPIATFYLPVPMNDVELRIETGGLRGMPREYLLACFWNDHLVPNELMSFADESVALKIPAEFFVSGSVQRLTIASQPLLPRQAVASDNRRLGMPIFCIEVRASSAEHAHSPLSRAA